VSEPVISSLTAGLARLFTTIIAYLSAQECRDAAARMRADADDMAVEADRLLFVQMAMTLEEMAYLREQGQ
jgi:hypothetical protein